VEITAGLKNEWIRVDRKRKARAARRSEFFGHVRNGVRRIFIFLFVATICVFVFNHYTEIQSLASAKLGPAIKKFSDPNNVRKKALNYEKEVDEITK
jgi:hypothetical protein